MSQSGAARAAERLLLHLLRRTTHSSLLPLQRERGIQKLLENPCYLCVSRVALMVPWKSRHCATRLAADDLLLYHISNSKVLRKFKTGSETTLFWADPLGLGKFQLNCCTTEGCKSFRGSFSPVKQSLLLRKTENHNIVEMAMSGVKLTEGCMTTYQVREKIQDFRLEL